MAHRAGQLAKLVALLISLRLVLPLASRRARSVSAESQWLTLSTANAISIIYASSVTPEFVTKVEQVSQKLGLDPDYLMACMKFESGLNAQAVNKVSGAIGLIQFMPTTARYLGTTTAALAKMSAVQQLDYVEKYFESCKPKTLEDTYMCILWPAAVNKPNNYVLFSAPSIAYKQNAGLDLNKDGHVTKEEAAARVVQLYKAGGGTGGGNLPAVTANKDATSKAPGIAPAQLHPVADTPIQQTGGAAGPQPSHVTAATEPQGDGRCTNVGGTCQVITTKCAGHYQRYLCSGAANRQCCLPGKPVEGDSRCTSLGGKCQITSTKCSGQFYYQPGVCDGPVNVVCNPKY